MKVFVCSFLKTKKLLAMSYIHYRQTKWKFHISSGYVNDAGINALKKGKHLDIFKPFRAQCYDQEFSESISLKRRQIFSGPNFDAPKLKYCDPRYWFYYQMNKKGEFHVVELNDNNRCNLNPLLNLTDDSWFRCNNKFYFVSQSLKKIVPISMF